MEVDDNNVSQIFEDKVEYAYKYIWSIKDVSKDFDTVQSREFSLEPLCTSKWKMVLSYCAIDESLRIGLRRADSSTHTVAVNADFTLRNSKDVFFVKRSLKASFAFNESVQFCEKPIPKPSHARGVSDDFKNQFRLRKDDILVIDGTIKVGACCTHNTPREKSTDELRTALMRSYKEGIYTDVNFVVDGEMIPAHKFMLAARSPVFKGMFESGMRENTDNQIVINDIEKSVLERFLEYLYTGSLSNFDTLLAVKLYTVADYYEVDSLKAMCRHLLMLDICEATVCQIISVADLLNDEVLYSSALCYLAKHFKDIFNTGGFKEIIKSNAELAAKIIAEVISVPEDSSKQTFSLL